MEIEEAVKAVGNLKSLGMAIIGIVVVIGIIKAVTANGVEGIAGNLLGLVTVVGVIFLLIGAIKFIFSKDERYSFNLFPWGIIPRRSAAVKNHERKVKMQG